MPTDLAAAHSVDRCRLYRILAVISMSMHAIRQFTSIRPNASRSLTMHIFVLHVVAEGAGR